MCNIFEQFILLDKWVVSSIGEIRLPILDVLMKSINWLGSVYVFTLLLIALIIILIRRKKRSNAILILTGVAGGWLIVELLKLFFIRLRPIGGLITTTGYSFPSGHATIATALFLLLVYLHSNQSRKRIESFVVICGAVLAILLVGFSRLYLGVHWLSDIIAGYAIGIIWVAVLIVIMNKKDV
jgi:undecaprenyl-diphosphatase